MSGVTTGRLFMVGSICFAVASLPGASSLSPTAVGIVYFTGSIFFTSAAVTQIRATSRANRPDFSSAAVQLAGTLLFNVSTFDAMRKHLSAVQHDLVVWTPDAVGSACFLAASALALAAARSMLSGNLARRIARINMAGSIAFGLSAVAAFVIPDRGDMLDATIARSMTLWGAICFFSAAYLLTQLADKPESRRLRATG